MVAKRVWTIINVSLGLIIILLLLNFFEVKIPSLGKGAEELKESSFCVIKNWQGEYLLWSDIDACCLEKRKFTFKCERDNRVFSGRQLDWNCLTGGKIEYWFDGDSYRYCQKILN